MNEPLEEQETGRDPIPSARDAEPDPEPFYRAANASLWLPIVAALFGKGISDFLKAAPGQVGWWAALVLGAVTAALLLTGFIAGSYALRGVAKHGRERILARSAIGLCLGLLLLGIFARGLVSDFSLARQNTKLAQSVQESLNKSIADLKKDREKRQEVTLGRPQVRPEGMQQTLGITADSKGDMVLLARASDAYMQKVQPAMQEFAAVAKALQDPPILNLSGVERQEQVQAKKALVQRFIAANDKLAVLAANSEKLLREEMEKASVPAKSVESVLAEYRKSNAAQFGLAVKIRDGDRRIGQALLGMLEVLDASWGRWSYDAQNQKPIFQQDAVQDKFIGYRNDLETASRDQERLQTQVANRASL